VPLAYTKELGVVVSGLKSGIFRPKRTIKAGDNTNLNKKSDLKRVRIGISSCLLGERVRYDGGHKRDSFLADIFGRYVEWVPVCPEFEMGLGVPRESLRLVDEKGDVRLIAPASGTDNTRLMDEYAEKRLDELEALQLCGYVLKRGSPSCGMERVTVYRNGTPLNRSGRGLFAERLVARFPYLPVEEEGRLNDVRLRENFVSRVFALRRWQIVQEGGLTAAALIQFHAQHKFVLMAHIQVGAKRLGALVGGIRKSTLREAARAYFDLFSQVMRHPPTVRNHTNVLQHMAGYISDRLAPTDRSELTELIDHYRRGLVPLIVPVTLLRHYVRKFEVSYLADQVYLDPHPDELMLLNHL
jgi:uncharacterized protein YbgA (DUF1722 family)/uncharacterized protein YbbK (DUF523 family)